MNIYLKKYFIVPMLLILFSCKTPDFTDNTIFLIKTTFGDIKIKLYPDTPIHRANFLKLVKTGFYDGVSFHRIIKDFMIQTGDPATKAIESTKISDSLKTYTLPSEINPKYFHKRGALAAARQGNNINPEMRSSGTQFYIVQGNKFTDDELNAAEQRINNLINQAAFNKILYHTTDSIRLSGKSLASAEIQDIASNKMFQFLATADKYKMSEDQRTIYKTIGGTPLLDGTYTVFGEVIDGMDIVEKISLVATDSNDRPLNDIRIIKIKILKQ
jgi:peptidylprolyl isomerase